MSLKKTTHIVFLLLWLMSIMGCNNRSSESIHINGQLVNIPKSIHTAFLDELQPTTSITIDTANINQLKGRFSFQIYTGGQEALYRIRIGKEQSFLLTAGKNDVTVTGDYTHMEKLQIVGSKASVELRRFIATLNQQNTAIRQLSERIEHPKSPVNDSILRLKKIQLQQEKSALVDTILQKARTTAAPTIALFALGVLNEEDLQQKGKAIFDGLQARFPRNELVKEAIAQYKKKLNNQGKSLAVGKGDPAPDLSYPNPEGKTISLTNLRGKYVLIDFWASWCAPCREANPGLVKVYKKFKNKNFTILGVSLDSKKEGWIKAIQQDGLTWQQMSDLKGWNSAPAAIYNVEAIPANFLVGPEGKILATNLYQDSLTITLNKLLASKKQ